MSYYEAGFQHSNFSKVLTEDLFDENASMSIDEVNRVLTLIRQQDKIADVSVHSVGEYQLFQPGKYIVQMYVRGEQGDQGGAAYVTLGSVDAIKKFIARLYNSVEVTA